MDRDYSGYVDSSYLDEQTRVLSAVKRRTYELMSIAAGSRVLDLGCGPGSDTLSLADLVGDSGQVFGVDFDPEMVQQANERAAAADLGGRVLRCRSTTTSSTRLEASDSSSIWPILSTDWPR